MRSDRSLAMTALMWLGSCLSLWLCSRVLVDSWERQSRLLRELMLMAGLAPPMEQTAPEPTPVPPPVEEMPSWAVGMTPEDLAAGIDPLTGRPLR
jgi:hypothetical protein